MNGYNLIRNWYNFKFSNPSKTKASHSDMYCYLVDQWNRLGQKKEFGLPTLITMEALGIGSYNTYKKTLDDLIEFGFVSIVKDSKNQHQSKIIALSKYDEATDKALDEATIKATDKPTDTIIKQKNKGTKEQEKEEINDSSESIDWDKLLKFFNDTFGKQSRKVPEKVKKSYWARIKEGYKKHDIMNAMTNASHSKFHKENNYEHLTLEFFSRADKIDKFSSISNNPFAVSADINDIDHPKHFVVNRFDVEWKLEKGIFYMDGKTVQNREFFMKFYDYEKSKYEKEQL